MYREIMIYDALRNNRYENIFLFPVAVVFLWMWTRLVYLCLAAVNARGILCHNMLICTREGTVTRALEHSQHPSPCDQTVCADLRVSDLFKISVIYQQWRRPVEVCSGLSLREEALVYSPNTNYFQQTAGLTNCSCSLNRYVCEVSLNSSLGFYN